MVGLTVALRHGGGLIVAETGHFAVAGDFTGTRLNQFEVLDLPKSS
jgi:hypothetical protein